MVLPENYVTVGNGRSEMLEHAPNSLTLTLADDETSFVEELRLNVLLLSVRREAPVLEELLDHSAHLQLRTKRFAGFAVVNRLAAHPAAECHADVFDHHARLARILNGFRSVSSLNSRSNQTKASPGNTKVKAVCKGILG